MSTVSIEGYVFTFLRNGDRIRVCWSSPWRSGLHFECAASALVDNVVLCVDKSHVRARVRRATESVLATMLQQPE